jgi:glycosyltransferase involved in cell wall biosynthesis
VILWIDKPTFFLSALLKALLGRFKMKEQINNHFIIIRTFTFLPFSRVRIIDMLNEILWVILVRFYGFLLPWKNRDTVTFVTHPLFTLPITGYKMVYDRCDRYGKYKDLNFMMSKRQSDDIKFMRKANLVINSSESLWKEALHYNRNSILARNGADLAHFKRALSLPKEGKKPVIGYVGALAYWVDFKLLLKIVETYPEYELHVIGPTGAVERNPDFMSLKHMKNVKIFGRIPYDNLPFYLKEFDVGIVPFTPDELIEAVDPLKVYEYMAAGRPVVSTDLPELRRLENCIYIAKNTDEFVRFCKQAVENPKVTREDLVKEAFENTWEKRAALIEMEIWKIIQ